MAEVVRFQVIRNVILALLVVSSAPANEMAQRVRLRHASIHGRVLDFRSQSALPGAVRTFHCRSAARREPCDHRCRRRLRDDGTGGGTFTVSVDGAFEGTARVTGPAYLGDLLIDRGTCVSRYGTVADARRSRPVGGATVAIGTHSVVSGQDGWYRIDLGCPFVPGFSNTTIISVTHPSFASYQQIIGRGVQGVRRIDLWLEWP